MAYTKAPQLDENNSRLYVSRPDQVKICYLNPNPARYQLSWGEQAFDGPHVLIVVEPPSAEPGVHGMKPMEIYGCEIEAFHATHRPSPDIENGWYKAAQVRAKRVDEPTEIVTVIDGRVESRSVVPPGHWIVQNPGGEQYYNTPEVFERNYVASGRSQG